MKRLSVIVPLASRDTQLAVLVVIIIVELKPHGVENRKTTDERNTDNPGKIPHLRLLSSFRRENFATPGTPTMCMQR